MTYTHIYSKKYEKTNFVISTYKRNNGKCIYYIVYKQFICMRDLQKKAGLEFN